MVCSGASSRDTPNDVKPSRELIHCYEGDDGSGESLDLTGFGRPLDIWSDDEKARTGNHDEERKPRNGTDKTAGLSLVVVGGGRNRIGNKKQCKGGRNIGFQICSFANWSETAVCFKPAW